MLGQVMVGEATVMMGWDAVTCYGGVEGTVMMGWIVGTIYGEATENNSHVSCRLPTSSQNPPNKKNVMTFERYLTI